eukprot:678774-Amphidinium_carterae.1
MGHMMGGDFNAAVYRYFASTRTRQYSPSVADSCLRSVLNGMSTVINNELQTQCGGVEQSWMENVFQYQLICANTADTISAYENATATARNSMTQR